MREREREREREKERERARERESERASVCDRERGSILLTKHLCYLLNLSRLQPTAYVEREREGSGLVSGNRSKDLCWFS